MKEVKIFSKRVEITKLFRFASKIFFIVFFITLIIGTVFRLVHYTPNDTVYHMFIYTTITFLSLFLVTFLLSRKIKEIKQIFPWFISYVTTFGYYLLLLILLIIFVPLLVGILPLMYPTLLTYPDVTIGLATVAMVVVITMSIIVTLQTHIDVMRHNEKLLEDTRLFHEPILKPRIKIPPLVQVKTYAKNNTHIRRTFSEYSLSVKNIGGGAATDVSIMFNYSMIPTIDNNEMAKEESEWPRTNPVGWTRLPPIGPNEEQKIGDIDGSNLIPGCIYIHIAYKNIFEEKKEKFYKFDFEDLTTTPEGNELIGQEITKKDYDKWIELKKA